jgi:hypothetical protein
MITSIAYKENSRSGFAAGFVLLVFASLSMILNQMIQCNIFILAFVLVFAGTIIDWKKSERQAAWFHAFALATVVILCSVGLIFLTI